MAKEQPIRSLDFSENFFYWIERLACILVLVGCFLLLRSSSVVSEPAGYLFYQAAVVFLILCKCFNFAIDIISQVYDKDKNRTESTDKEKTEQEEAKVEFSAKGSKEEVEAKDGRNKKDEENTRQEKASWKDSTEEVKAKGESINRIDEENTGRQKPKLDFSTLKEENDRRSFDCFDGWEEERSQLIYELGAARASAEIYRQMLHDLHHHDQPHKLLA